MPGLIARSTVLFQVTVHLSSERSLSRALVDLLLVSPPSGTHLPHLVLGLLNPAETDKFNGRMLDVSLVEEFNNFGKNISPQIAALREGECHES